MITSALLIPGMAVAAAWNSIYTVCRTFFSHTSDPIFSTAVNKTMLLFPVLKKLLAGFFLFLTLIATKAIAVSLKTHTMDNSFMDFDKMPRVDLWGITVLEPSTVITNIFITIACFYAFYDLKRKKLNIKGPLYYISYFFLLMGIATLAGGVIGHAFLYATGMWGKIPGWYISMAGVAFFERGVIAHSRPLMGRKIGHFLSIFNYVEIFTFMVLSLLHFNFVYVEIHATYGLLVLVFGFELYVFLKTNNPAFKYIATATVFGLLAAFCHTFHWGINEWFNENDVSHLAMVASIIFYHKAALNLHRVSASTSKPLFNSRPLEAAASPQA